MDVRGKLIRHNGGRDIIVVRREAWEERTQYTIAHELGERYAETVCLRAGEGFDDLSSDFIESLAHRFASRLLCPQPWFDADNAIHDGDLFALKDRYETASHEVIAFRLLQLETPSVVTVIDNGRITRRRANRSGLRTKQLTPAERNTWERCRLTGRDTKTDHGPARIAAWPIWTESVRREIVRMWLVDDVA